MSEMNRREFLKLSAKLVGLMGLQTTALPKVAEALEALRNGQIPVLWLQAQSCSGCSVSFMNADAPGVARVLTSYVSLIFHSTLSTATGKTCSDIINRTVSKDNYYLAVEGSLPVKMPRACTMGHEPLTDIVKRAAEKASAVIAVGSCAAFGGIPAAENNPTGATHVSGFLAANGISTPVINIPGCPTHPDWVVGSLVHVIKFGLPELDDKNRPKMFFSRKIHDQCPRFADYERERFAKTYGDEGCLFELGCSGVLTHGDCTLRDWNGSTNNCIKSGAPCIGCASDHFAARADFPFYTKKKSDAERNA